MQVFSSRLTQTPQLLGLGSRFGFFGKTISRKAGQKCCPYNQNGKPLSQDKVEEFLAQYGDMRYWNTNEDFTRLTRSYYLKNIFCATEFVKDLYSADSISTQQIPNVSILDQDIVRVELHTQPLKGLSFRDFELALIIDSFDLEKYNLVALETEKGYKKVIRTIRIDEEMLEMESEILASEGTKRPSKFKTSDYSRSFGTGAANTPTSGKF